MSLLEDARNIQRKDPAARSVLEVILLYPGFHILVYHRIAHWLYEHGHFFLARWVSQHGRHKTGIEIHPGAQIGRWCVSTTRPSTPPTTWTSRICRMSWPNASPSWTAASANWKRTHRGMCPPASTRSSRNSSAEPLGPTLRASFPHRGAAGMAVLSAKTEQSFCKTKAAALRTHGTQLLFCYFWFCKLLLYFH